MTDEQFTDIATPILNEYFGEGHTFDLSLFAQILKARVTVLTEIPEMVDFFKQLPDYDKELFVNKKSKTNLENAPVMLDAVIKELEALHEWTHDALHDALISLAERLEVKNGTVMWPARIAAAGKTVTPGGAIEIFEILGREETLKRLKFVLEKLEA